MLKEAEVLDVPVHRVSQGSGVWMLTDAEISEMAGACAERNVELCLFTGPRRTWDAGAGTRTPSGGAGLRARGHDALAGCVEDAVRATELGVRCLLVADEGVPHTLHRLRTRGVLPADTTLKVSALIGPVNPASYAVFGRLGADSINVPSDLSLEHLTEIRRVSRAPMDFYLEAPDDLGGYVRMYDAAELIRRGAPVYLKFGLSKAPRHPPLRRAPARRDPGDRPRAGPPWPARPGSAGPPRHRGRDVPARLPSARPPEPLPGRTRPLPRGGTGSGGSAGGTGAGALLLRTVRSNMRQYGMLVALALIVVLFQIWTDGNLLKPVNVSNTVLIGVVAVAVVLFQD